MAADRNWTRSQLKAWKSIGLVVSGSLFLGGTPLAQSVSETASKTYLEGARQSELGYSRAVITRGGEMVWLSGTAGPRDADGQPITDFREQARQAYRNLDTTLREIGSDLSDVVNVTVLLRDPRYYEAFTEVRKEFYPEGSYPASTIVTNASFVIPEILVLLQAVAVIDQ